MKQLTLTPHHAKYFAHDLTRRAAGGMDRLSMALFDAAVALNPHQIEASLFALQSPLSKGVILADEVGLGKTIEAGIVLCQFWAERKRRLLVSCPASIRKQWALELEEKFNLPVRVLDAKAYREARRSGQTPLGTNAVVVMSHHYANRLREQLKTIAWDLVVIDEAHKLRNAYRSSNKVGQGIRWATEDCRKLLLTATPLQNSLLELYGLSTLIDERLFGDVNSFRSQYASAGSNLEALRQRLSVFCKRSLRNEVMEYIRYTERRPITRPFKPTDEEHALYEAVSGFLQREDSYALPRRQRHLTALILRKLLASSSQAIAATLDTLRVRLEALRDEQTGSDPDFTAQLIEAEEIEDDLLVEILAESEDANQPEAPPVTIDRQKLHEEIGILQRLATWARTIGIDTKARALLKALEVGFEQMATTGAARKALIFTESRRTQEYLKVFLESHGYGGQVVLFNGTNGGPEATAIYERWTEENLDTGRASGSRTVNVRTALIEHFDEDVHQRLRLQLVDAQAQLDRVGRRFWSLTRFMLDGRARFDDAALIFDLEHPPRAEIRKGRYHLISKSHPRSGTGADEDGGETRGVFLYRLSHPFGEHVVDAVKTLSTPPERAGFDVTNHPTRLHVVEAMRGRYGYLTTRLAIDACEREEYLLFSGFDEAGESLDQDTMEKLIGCAGRTIDDGDGGSAIPEAAEQSLDHESQRHTQATVSRSLDQNNTHFNESREKLERWADDMVLSAEKVLLDTNEQIKALRRQPPHAITLADQREIQEKIGELERQQRRQRREIFKVEDEIIAKRHLLIDSLEGRLAQRTPTEKSFHHPLGGSIKRRALFMNHVIVGPVLQHLRMIGLERGAITIATAFYSSRALSSLSILAESVTMVCRLDFDSIEEWKRGFVSPDTLLSFLHAHHRRGAEALLYAAPTAHAKVYLGNHAALTGSANLTIRGFGGGHEILNRLQGRQALRETASALRKYRSSLKRIEFAALQEYVETNQSSVRRAKAKMKQKPDQLPETNWSARSHLGNYTDFLNWLENTPAVGASVIRKRARGQHSLQGHIDRNFHGLRQFFLAFPEVFDRMQHTDPDTYKLSRDGETEKQICDFVRQFAADEEGFVLDRWKTYLPKECGGRAGRHGGTIGNLNYMLPLVAGYLVSSLTD